MLGENIMLGAISSPCFTDTTDIFKDNSGVALYTLDYDASDTGGASGKFGEAAIFNGSSSNISVNGSILNSRTAVSYSAWVYYRGTGSGQSYGHIISGGSTNSTAGGKAFGIAVRNSDDLLYIWASNSQSSFSSTALPKNVWTHLAITNSGGTAKMYMNGSLIHTSNPTSLAFNSSSNNLRIGEYFYNGSHHFYGKIDQVRIFNTVLTQSQITQLYQENSSTVGTHLFGCLANYNLDGSAKESMGTTAYDGTETDITYKYDGTPTNVDFGVGGKSLYGARFNGSSRIGTGITSFTNTFSLSMWLNPSSLPSVSWIFGNWNSTTQDIYIIANSSGQVEINFDGQSGGQRAFGSAGDLTLGNWTHFAVSMNSGSYVVYINGSSVGTYSTTNTTFDNGQDFEIGNVPKANSNPSWNGKIDQVRVFNKAISSSEVSKLYGNGAGEIACKYTATTNTHMFGCIANYNFDNSAKESMGTSAYDGTESNIEYRFGRFGQAAVFNGSSSKIDFPDLGDETSQVSISFWLNTTSAATVSNIYIGGVNGQYSWLTIQLRSGKIAAKLNNNIGGGLSGSNVITSSTYNDGNWHHIACVFTGTYGTNQTPIIYVDGSVAATVSAGGTFTTGLITSIDGRAALGYFRPQTNSYFEGNIDQVRIFSTVLSSSQVSQLYNEKPEVDTSNFKAVLYEGTGATQYISNIGMDLETNGGLLWIKNRHAAYNNVLYDHVRNSFLYSNLANDEDTNSTISFEKNGFQTSSTASAQNANNNSYVAWVWKGGGDAVAGTGTGVTNVSISANTEAGFSIVKYTGGDSASDTVNHGLTDAEMIILKDLDDGSNNWRVWHKDLTANYWLYLNLTNAQASAAADGGIRNVNSNNFGFINGATAGVEGVNSSASNYIAYIWKSVAGYSKIGSYTGGGTTKRIYVDSNDDGTGTGGFKPSFVIIKASSSIGSNQAYGSWVIHDDKRAIESTDNVTNPLYANRNYQEGLRGQGSSGSGVLDLAFNDDGFTINHNGYEANGSGITYIYMAFK